MSEIPRIAINGTYIQQRASGLGVVNQNLISQLMQGDRSFDFTLYSQANYWQNLDPDKIAPVSAALSPEAGFKGHLRRIFWYQTQLNQLLKQSQTDLLFSPVSEGILFSSVPQIVTVHDLIPLKYPELNPKWKYYYLYILPLILKQSRHIICVSQHTKQDLIEKYRLDPETIDVVYLGYNRDLFHPQSNSAVLQKYRLDKYLLYVGDLRFYKNLSRCLTAFDRLPLNDYQLAIAGKKDDVFYPEIKRQTAGLSSKDRIIFLDYVPAAELPILYSMAQSLVFASLYEGFGLPILEAMACGCPVIASNATSIPEVGGDSVAYVDPYDVDDIARVMYRILTDRELKTNLARQGLKRAKLFSWEQTARDSCQVFQRCLPSS